MLNGVARAALRLPFLAGLMLALFALGSPASAQVKAFATYSVDTVKAAGNLDIDFTTVAKDDTKTTTEKTIAVAGTDKPADVAMKIAAALGGKDKGFVSNGAKVEYDVGASGNKAAGFSGAPNNVVGFTIDTENRVALLPPANQQQADLAFLPNLSNGSETLATDSMITAGFAVGLSPVSFEASAGEDLEQLATMLNAALMTGGYLTSMPDPRDVVISAKGASLPLEVDFSIDPLSVVGPDGDIEIQGTTSVPEPSSWLLLLAGVGGVGVARRELLRKRGLRIA